MTEHKPLEQLPDDAPIDFPYYTHEEINNAVEGLKEDDDDALSWLMERLTPLGLQDAAIVMVNKIGANRKKWFGGKK